MAIQVQIADGNRDVVGEITDALFAGGQCLAQAMVFGNVGEKGIDADNSAVIGPVRKEVITNPPWAVLGPVGLPLVIDCFTAKGAVWFS